MKDLRYGSIGIIEDRRRDWLSLSVCKSRGVNQA